MRDNSTRVLILCILANATLYSGFERSTFVAYEWTDISNWTGPLCKLCAVISILRKPQALRLDENVVAGSRGNALKRNGGINFQK